MPTAAGVGSAVGFLRAPISYEVVRSRYACLDDTFDPDLANAIFAEMRAEAEAIVAGAAPGAALVETRTADMRYRGQGHELSVVLPVTELDAGARETLSDLFDVAYSAAYARRIPDLDVEVMNWTLRLSVAQDPPAPCPPMPESAEATARRHRPLFDPDSGPLEDVPAYRREDLGPGALIHGPAVIAEDETSTVVMESFRAQINALGYIEISKEQS